MIYSVVGNYPYHASHLLYNTSMFFDQKSLLSPFTSCLSCSYIIDFISIISSIFFYKFFSYIGFKFVKSFFIIFVKLRDTTQE